MGVVRTAAHVRRGIMAAIVSSVEAVLEFGEVARNMLAIDGTVGSCDGGLDVAERRVGPI